VNRLVPMMVPEPMGLRPALRLLELRRMGIDQALSSGADRLGFGSDWREAQRMLLEEEGREQGRDPVTVARDLMTAAGIQVPENVADIEPPGGIDAAHAVRLIAAAMQLDARAQEERQVRAGVWNHGAAEGWQRTVAALVHREVAASAPEEA